MQRLSFSNLLSQVVDKNNLNNLVSRIFNSTIPKNFDGWRQNFLIEMGKNQNFANINEINDDKNVIWMV